MYKYTEVRLELFGVTAALNDFWVSYSNLLQPYGSHTAYVFPSLTAVGRLRASNSRENLLLTTIRRIFVDATHGSASSGHTGTVPVGSMKLSYVSDGGLLLKNERSWNEIIWKDFLDCLSRCSPGIRFFTVS